MIVFAHTSSDVQARKFKTSRESAEKNATGRAARVSKLIDLSFNVIAIRCADFQSHFEANLNDYSFMKVCK